MVKFHEFLVEVPHFKNANHVIITMLKSIEEPSLGYHLTQSTTQPTNCCGVTTVANGKPVSLSHQCLVSSSLTFSSTYRYALQWPWAYIVCPKCAPFNRIQTRNIQEKKPLDSTFPLATCPISCSQSLFTGMPHALLTFNISFHQGNWVKLLLTQNG